MDERALIKRPDIGIEVLPERQIAYYEKLLRIIDPNPQLDWKGVQSHNTDFCVIENSIEPTRSFVLKAQKVAGYSSYSYEPTTTPVDGDVLVAVRCRLWDDESEVTATGGCSLSEVARKKSKRGYHDAVAIAETRAFKRALEAKAGLPFINLIIMQMFGRFATSGAPPERDVTEKPPPLPKKTVPVENAEMVLKIKAELSEANERMPSGWARQWWNRTLAAAADVEVLTRYFSEIKKEVVENA